MKKKINSSTNKLENREPKIELEDLKTTKNEILVKKLTHSKQFDSSLLPMEKKTKLGEEKKKENKEKIKKSETISTNNKIIEDNLKKYKSQIIKSSNNINIEKKKR